MPNNQPLSPQGYNITVDPTNTNPFWDGVGPTPSSEWIELTLQEFVISPGVTVPIAKLKYNNDLSLIMLSFDATLTVGSSSQVFSGAYNLPTGYTFDETIPKDYLVYSPPYVSLDIFDVINNSRILINNIGLIIFSISAMQGNLGQSTNASLKGIFHGKIIAP